MIGVLVILGFLFTLLIGVPVAYSLGLGGILGIALLGNTSLVVISQRFYETLNSFPLVAIPLFLLMANLMDFGNLSESIVKFANSLVGRLRGALAIGNVMSCMFFAGISGSSLADTVSVGSIFIPLMKREGYNPGFSAALTAAASMVGPIIPPSILMILYGYIAGVSVIKLFVGGIIPGLMLGLVFGIYAYIISRKMNYGTCHAGSIREVTTNFTKATPAMVIPFIIILGVTSGIFTITESASIVSLYALTLVVFILIARKQLSEKFGELLKVVEKTGEDTAVVAILISASGLLGWALTRSHLPEFLRDTLLSTTSSPIVILIIINLILLVLGMLLAPAPGLLIGAPLFLPIVNSIHMDPVHFGIMIVLNLQIGTLTPPVANAAFICARIADISFEEVIVKLLPFILMAFIILMLITFIPQISLFLPNLVK